MTDILAKSKMDCLRTINESSLIHVIRESETIKATVESVTAAACALGSGGGKRVIEPEISEVDLDVDC